MGWPRKQAEAYTLIAGGLKAPLAAAVRERSKRYAASTQVLCEALAQRARQMTQPAPLVYINLTGLAGLATDDPAWQALTHPGASASLSFVTDGLVAAVAPRSGSADGRPALPAGRFADPCSIARRAGRPSRNRSDRSQPRVRQPQRSVARSCE